MSKNRISLYAVLISFIAIIFFRFEKPFGNILTWDVFGYYLYLPLSFIYHDLGIHNFSVIDQILGKYHSTAAFYQGIQLDNGNWCLKYSTGLAIIYLPFFLLGHIYALLSSFPADGFSKPYQDAIMISGIVYALIGLYFIRKILLNFFTDGLAALVILIIVIGTNYFEYITYNGTMPHNYLFAIHSITVWNTIRWHQHYKKRNMFFIGMFGGLATVSRPTEIIILIVPLLWNIWNKEEFKKKILYFYKNSSQLIVFSAGFILMILPQLLYWKVYTGYWLFYSYKNPGEGFDFLSPHTLKFLFSFRKGWLLYTPVMIFAIGGFVYIFRNKRNIFYALFIYLFLHIYISSSWSYWSYAASFSQRTMIQAYPVLAVSLGFFMTSTMNMKILIRWIIYILMGFFVILNIFQTWQFQHYIIDIDRMTKPYYFRVFGKTHVSDEDKKLLLVERSADGKDIFTDPEDYTERTLGFDGFEKPGSPLKNYCDTLSHSGKYSYILDKDHVFSPNIHSAYEDITTKDHIWIRASIYVYPVFDPSDNPGSLVVTMDHKGGAYGYHTADIEKKTYNVKPNQWNKLQLEVLSPPIRSGRDHLSVYFWDRGQKEIFVDDLKVEVFVPVWDF